MELQQETIPLQNGYRFYNILGLKASKCFSIQLKSDPSDFGLNKNRRLLNTEKLIFNVKNHNWTSGDSKLYALVTVESEGIVGKLHVQERELVIFNIVCDELALGISYDAWWIGILVLLCLGLALIIPCALPPYLFQKDRISCSSLQKSS
ncbi:hypothetical protein QJS04_geneDACA000528 [Acorus gramineus]|uniref:Uncharacterized protein n=1 Tax=Acorus gramineus TaxID=55184 RepID=A0AAV9AQ22_ACOGR|nr:hypothetical protein QJS04_geneDACA000528 [Acorus gramineus]